MSDAFIYVRERQLPYEVFDADNHLYENREALTKFIQPEYDGIIKYVDIGHRTKVAIKDKKFQEAYDACKESSSVSSVNLLLHMSNRALCGATRL